jgi:hypothetical protein
MPVPLMTSGRSGTQVNAVSGNGRSPNRVPTHLVQAVICALQIAGSGVAGVVQNVRCGGRKPPVTTIWLATVVLKSVKIATD